MHRIALQLLLLIVVAAVAIIFAPKVNLSLNKNIASWQDVPEMKDLLQTEDQDTRLKAARKLVERVDVEQALEIMEHSPLPHTGEGHLAVHQIGFYAYQKYGLESILKCRDYFLYACYHGAIIEAASDQGIPAIKQMTDYCKASATRHFQCVHAAGHAILAIWDYSNLPDALKTCDELYEKETEFPNALSSCHNGAFMENLFGVHDWGTGKEAEREWLSDDPNFPCNYFGEKYQRGCWLNQGARIYQMNGGDIAKTSEICQQIDNPQYVEWCMDNLARQIHPLTNGDITKVFSLCPLVGDAWREHCVSVNAGAYYSVGGRNEAIAVCRTAIPQTKPKCYELVVGQIISDPIEPKQKFGLCQQLEEPHRSQCLSQTSLLN
ncbi:hypothetical protein HYZ78_03890 [Candidatus Microgenomates bacterium]|nr:hypothetical protein [Candidatus Microgenomates bacterium]